MSLKLSSGNGSVLSWYKSSHSTNDGPACVEVAAVPGIVHVRDSKDPQGPSLAFRGDAWAAFVAFARER